MLRYAGSGTDGIWFTEDDLFHSREISTFDSNDNLLTHNFIYSGVDDFMDTSDDYTSKSYRQIHKIDEKEHRIIRNHVENFGTENENIIWSDIGVYDLEDNILGVNINIASALLTPEQFSFNKYSIDTSSIEGEETKNYKKRSTFRSSSTSIDEPKIEDIVGSISPEELTLTVVKKIKTVSLKNNVSQSIIESNNEFGVKTSRTYIEIIRNQQ